MNATPQNSIPPQEAVQISIAQTIPEHEQQYLIINGPNLNMLGLREPSIYGSTTLADVIRHLEITAQRLGVSVFAVQSNNEGEIIDLIHRSRGHIKGIVINPGAWAHTSLALADALPIAEVPVIEVHISNVYARESFRHHSYVSAVSKGVISGLGPYGYSAALEFVVSLTQD